jgi:hypothetical protein
MKKAFALITKMSWWLIQFEPKIIRVNFGKI